MDARRRRSRALIALLGVVMLAAGTLAWWKSHAEAARPAAAIEAATVSGGEPFARQVRAFVSTPAQPAGFVFVGNARDHRYHRPDCALVQALAEPVTLTSRGQAEALGYQPCDICKP